MYIALFWSSLLLTLLVNMCSGEILNHKVELSGEICHAVSSSKCTLQVTGN